MSSDVVAALRSALRLRYRRPPHAFVLSRERLAHVFLEKRARGSAALPPRLHAEALPGDTFRAGPGDVPVAGRGLARAVSALLSRCPPKGKVAAASLAVPDAFMRAIAIELEDPTRQPKETEEVVRWKFEKLLGLPGASLRLSWEAVGQGAKGTRVIAVAAPEEAVASWEEPFLAAGVRIGALETSALALAPAAHRTLSGDGFLLWAEDDSATTLFFKNGRVEFLRTRETTDPDEALQEVRLAASFMESGGEGGPLDVAAACVAGPPGSPVIERFVAFRVEMGGAPPVLLSRSSLAPGLPQDPREAGTEAPAFLVGLGILSGEEGRP